jgi:hypothetical protein
MTTHSVYVVELDLEVLSNKKFVGKNPNYQEGMRCYYVGMTGLSPEDRFSNHKRGYKGSRFVRTYGKCLCPQEYEHLNPMTYKNACSMEVQLATDLRNKGHAVWQN